MESCLLGVPAIIPVGEASHARSQWWSWRVCASVHVQVCAQADIEVTQGSLCVSIEHLLVQSKILTVLSDGGAHL